MGGAVVVALGLATTASLLVGAGTLATSGVLGSRVDRTVVGLVVGAALGLCGAVLQGAWRNPLADPGLLGLTGGASLAVVIGVTLGLSSPAATTTLAVLGVLLVATVVHLLTRRVAPSRRALTTVLAGAAVSAAALSMTTALLLTSRATLDEVRRWQVGSVAGRDPEVLLPVGGLLAIGALLPLLICSGLDALALGEESAAALGHDLPRLHAVALLSATLLCAGATAAAGPVAFIGFLVPHLTRSAAGLTHTRLLPLSAAVGGVLVVVADTAGRVVAPPTEVPVGIAAAIVGAPLLGVLAVRRGLV